MLTWCLSLLCPFGGVFFVIIYKNEESGGAVLEKMRKKRAENKKIEKKLDIVLAKCYNMLYC